MFKVENNETTLETDNIDTSDVNFINTNDTDNTVETIANITISLDENNRELVTTSIRTSDEQLRPMFEINNDGAIRINSSYGTAGQLLQTSGQDSNSLFINHTDIPYHLVFGASPNSGNSFIVQHQINTVIDTLFVRTSESPISLYNQDLSNSTTWSPSVSGVYLINCMMNITGGSDSIASSTLAMQKLGSTGWEIFHSSNDRRYQTSAQLQQSDSYVYTNSHVICTTIYVQAGEEFRWTIDVRLNTNTNIGLSVAEQDFKISITKVDAITSTVVTGNVLNFNENTNLSTISRIAGLFDETNGGQIQLFTKPNTVGSTLTERMRILGNGRIGVETSSPEELFHVNGNMRTNRLIVDAIELVTGTRNYIHLQSGDISLSAETKGPDSNQNNLDFKEFTIRGWVNPDNSATSDAGSTTSSQDRNIMFQARLYNTNTSNEKSLCFLKCKNRNFLQHESIANNESRVTLLYNNLQNSSDDRLKHNEINITDGLEVLRKLRAKSYDLSHSLGNSDTTVHDVGFIAQEVYTIPQLKSFVDNPETSDNPEHDGIWKLNYEPIFIYTTQAVKELDTTVQKNTTEINNLKLDNNLIKSKLNEILTEMGKETI